MSFFEKIFIFTAKFATPTEALSVFVQPNYNFSAQGVGLNPLMFIISKVICCIYEHNDINLWNRLMFLFYKYSVDKLIIIKKFVFNFRKFDDRDIISETCDVMIESFLKIKQYFDF